MDSMADWRAGRAVSDRYLYMQHNNLGCDVTFVVGEGRQVPAHTFMLICRSAVFEAMFCGSMAEHSDNRFIKITDIDEDIFLAFIRYLYVSDIALDDHNTLPILYVARKYCVDDLVQICADFLRQKMNPETVCDIMEQAHTYDIDDLKEMCLQYIFENGSSVLLSSGFNDLCFDCVRHIIQSNDLFVEESDVYTALTVWAGHECRRRNLEMDAGNKRSVLGKVMFYIRFPTMDRIFFTDVVSKDDLLNDTEKIALFQHMFGSIPKLDLPFPSKQREAKIIQCLRFPKNDQGFITCEPGFKNSNFGIDVHSSDDVMLHGLVLFGACSSPPIPNQPDTDSKLAGSSYADQHLKIVISAVPHQSESYTFEYDGVEVPQKQSYNLHLKEPVLMKRGRMYAIQVKLDLFLPYQTFSGTSGLQEVDSGSIKFNFLTHQSLIATTAEKGQIAGLLFSKLPDPDRKETSLSPRGSPVRKDPITREDYRTIFCKRELF